MMINKDIYSQDKGIHELVLSDFLYTDNKLYINNPYFKDKKGLIVFYAPWCKHCKKISSFMINLALDNINLVNFGAVNIENIEDKNDLLADYAKVIQYPTIKYIKDDGSLENYPFDYTEDNLIYFVNTNI